MFEKMEPIKGGHGGCLHCGYQHEVLPMKTLIAVGFGVATVKKNDETVYSEEEYEHERIEKLWTAQDAEDAARKEPDADWRIHLIAPLSERHYQRQGENYWVLYEKGKGFA